MIHSKISLAIVGLSICAAQAGAAIVFQDNFNRVGALHGSTPSTSAGSNWTASSGFVTDGSKVAGSFDFSNFLSSAYVPLPVSITSGNVYTLSATMYRGLSTDDTAIMIFGFFDATPSWNGSAVVDEGHAIAMAPRNNRDSVNTMLNGFVNPNDYHVADGTNGTTFGIRLYETAPNTWSAVALELSPTSQLILGAGSPSPVSLANIHSIGLISGALLPPYIDNFTLDVSSVPEPCTLASVACGMLALGRKRRRERDRA